MILDNVRLFDGRTWRNRTRILVEGATVAEVGPSACRPGHDVVSLEGASVLPGLIDAHMHLFPGFLKRLPLFGVTAAIDMFATPNLVARLRAERQREPAAAEFITAGVGTTVPGGHPCQLSNAGLYTTFPVYHANTSARRFVEARILEGSSFIKVFVDDGRLGGVMLPHLTFEQLRAICDAAHEKGLLVVAHAPIPKLAAMAIGAGVDGLAHAIVPSDHDTVYCRDLLDRMQSDGIFIISTLCAIGSTLGVSLESRVRGSTINRYVGPGWRAHAGRLARPESDNALWQRTLEAMADLIARDVRILAGTDAAFPGVIPGASLHIELQLLVECGMSLTKAIRSATADVADTFSLSGRGVVGPGAVADLLVVDGGVRSDVRCTQEIAAIMVRGNLIYPD